MLFSKSCRLELVAQLSVHTSALMTHTLRREIMRLEIHLLKRRIEAAQMNDHLAIDETWHSR